MNIQSKATYSKDTIWREIQEFLPEENRLDDKNSPKEEWVQFDDIDVHVDHYVQENAKATLIVLHGVGGNGRLLSFIAMPLWRQGYEVVCPDLPMYGHTVVNRTVSYEDWVNCSVLIAEKYRRKGVPLFLFGLSAGGMLAYQTACKIDDVAGVMVTCILDQRIHAVTKGTASSKMMAVLGKPFLKLTYRMLGKIKLPMKAVCNMKAIVNNKTLAGLLMRDPLSSGAKVTLKFLYGLLNPKIEIEAWDYYKCPILLVHPQKDYWTDISLSWLFFDEIPGKKEMQILEDAGHFPIESKGLRQLEAYCVAFMEEQS